jgi:histidinol-phosphate aminotransferase
VSGDEGVGGYVRPGAAAGAVRLDLNEAPHGIGVAFEKRLLELLAESPWNRYPAIDAEPARKAAAELYGWRPEGTLVGNGSNELLAAAVRALLPRGGRVVSLTPSFSMYPVLAARQAAALLGVSLTPPDFAVPTGELLDRSREADLILLCSPNNPTGGLVPEQVWDEVLALGKPTIWDGAYVEFAGVDPAVLLARHEHLIVLHSFSKAWGLAGLRIGALLAHPAMARKVVHELLPFGSGWLGEAAMRAAAEHPEAGRALVAELVVERDRLRALLAEVPGVRVVPSAANFFLLGVGRLDGHALAEALGSRGIAVRSIPELAAAGYVRLSVSAAADRERLVAAVREVAGG